MWERINKSEVVVRRNILPARVVLDRDAEFGEYRTYLEFIPRDCHPTFLNGRILRDLECALEDFIAAKAKIVRRRVTRWAYTPSATATCSQAVSRSTSSCRRYTVVTASELWSRKRLTCSIDSPASRRSLAAECRKMWTPAGRSPATLKYLRMLP